MKYQKIKEIASKIQKHDFATIAALLKSADDGDTLQLPEDNALAYLNGSVLADEMADKTEYDEFYAALVGPELDYLDGIVNNIARRYFCQCQDCKVMDTLETTRAIVKNDLKLYKGDMTLFVLIRLRNSRDQIYQRCERYKTQYQQYLPKDALEVFGNLTEASDEMFASVESQHCNSFDELPKIGKQIFSILTSASDETLAAVALRLCDKKNDLSDELLLDKNDIAILDSVIHKGQTGYQRSHNIRRRLIRIGKLLEANNIDPATDMTEVLDAFRLAIHTLVDRRQMEAAV